MHIQDVKKHLGIFKLKFLDFFHFGVSWIFHIYYIFILWKYIHTLGIRILPVWAQSWRDDLFGLATRYSITYSNAASVNKDLFPSNLHLHTPPIFWNLVTNWWTFTNTFYLTAEWFGKYSWNLNCRYLCYIKSLDDVEKGQKVDSHHYYNYSLSYLSNVSRTRMVGIFMSFVGFMVDFTTVFRVSA